MRSNVAYFRPAMLAGLILAVINFSPGLFLLNCFCCAGFFLGGVLAVVFYKMDLPEEQKIMNADGLYLGIWTGIFAAGFETVLDLTIGPFVIDLKIAMVEGVMKAVLGSFQMPNDLSDLINQAIAETKHPGLASTLVGFILGIIRNSIFTIAGGLLTTAVIQKRKSKQG